MTVARLRRALILPVLLGLLVILAKCWSRERLLLDRAANVAAMDDWDEYRAHKKAAFGHNWLSDHEVLFARVEENAEGQEQSQYLILDTHSGIIAPAAKYEKALQMAEAYYGVRFAPNRQWFYAQHRNGDGLDVVKWDGSRKYSFKEKGYPLLWLTDSLYINDISAEDYSDELNTEKWRLRLRSVADSRILRDLPGPGDNIIGSNHILYCVDHFVKLSAESDEATHQVSVTVTATGLGLKDYPTQKGFVLLLPNQQNIKDVEANLSPDGTRIVYRCVSSDGVSPLLVWIHRLYPHFDPKPQLKVALWVSEVDGKHLHEVGHINLGEEKDYLDTYLDFEWLPSGKRLAFRYKERLYTVLPN